MEKIKKVFSMDTVYSIQGQQLLNLGLLFILGKTVMNLEISYLYAFFVIVISVFIEHFLIFLRNKKLEFFSISSVLTALGLSFMLNVSEFWIFPVVLFIAFGQKYFLRMWGHHVFNPSNLAVSVALIFFAQETSVHVGQWGNQIWFGLILLALGLLILYRVKRLHIPAAFLVFYLIMQFSFVSGKYDFAFDFSNVWQNIVAGAFMIYIIFMLTDPRTTPKTYIWQVIFAFLVAALTTALDHDHGYYPEFAFISLTAVSALVPIMRILGKEEMGKADGIVKSINDKRAVIAISLILFIIIMHLIQMFVI